MNIYRDGKAIELTAEEMRNAYYEQQKNFDKDDLLYNGEAFGFDVGSLTEESVEEMSERYRQLLNGSDRICDAEWGLCRLVFENAGIKNLEE